MKLAYSYAIDPTAGIEHFDAEHNRTVSLWDTLADIYAEHLREIEELASADNPRISEIEQAIPLAETKKDRWALIKEKRAALIEWRKEHKEVVKAKNRERLEQCKQARQATDAWWPNYNSALARHEAAISACLKKNRRIRHHDPERDDAMLCVQIQRTKTGLGAAPDEIYAGLSMLQITPADDHTRHGRRTMGRMQVDANGNQIEFICYFHRPLPQCRIKGAQIVRKRVANEYRWSLVLQLDAQHQIEPAKYVRSGSLLLSWSRSARGGLLVAATEGAKYELPATWMARMGRVESLRSWLDKSRDEARAKWADHAPLLDMPEREMLQAMLLRRDTLPEALMQWRRAWKKRWEEMHHLRDKLLRQRREYYRLWAREIVREYTELVMDDTDLSWAAIKDRNSEDNTLRQRACAHYLRMEIVHQANKHGSRVTDASGKVLTHSGDEKSSAWARRKAGKQEHSQSGVETRPGTE